MKRQRPGFNIGQLLPLSGSDAKYRSPSAQLSNHVRLRAKASPQNPVTKMLLNLIITSKSNCQCSLANPWETVDCRKSHIFVGTEPLPELLHQSVTAYELLPACE